MLEGRLDSRYFKVYLEGIFYYQMGLFLYQGGQHFGKAEGNIGNY
jgi:hypothetical protein